MLKYKIKGKHLDDAHLVESYFMGWYATEFSCRDAAVELSKIGYETNCLEQGKDGVFTHFRTYKARTN